MVLTAVVGKVVYCVAVAALVIVLGVCKQEHAVLRYRPSKEEMRLQSDARGSTSDNVVDLVVVVALAALRSNSSRLSTLLTIRSGRFTMWLKMMSGSVA